MPKSCNSLLAAPLSRTAEDQRGCVPRLQPIYSSQDGVGHLKKDAQEVIERRNRNLVHTQRDGQHSIAAAENDALPVESIQDFPTVDKVTSKARGKDQTRLKLTAPDLTNPDKEPL